MMGRRARVAIGCAAGLLWAPGASAAPCTVEDLSWMAGVWRNATGAEQTEERWVMAPGGRLMGSSWTLHADSPRGVIESNSIQLDGAQVAMRLRHFSADLVHAREDKDAPMLFTAARCAAQSAVFDGQGPQAGEHITYRRAGDRLTFIGDFIHQGAPIHVEVAFTRGAE
jgi:hypothetical protein